MLLGLLLSLVACQAYPPADPSVTVYDATLAVLLRDYTATQNQKRAALEFTTGDKADNCVDYTRLSKQANLKAGVNNQIVKSEYLVCDALELIGKGDINAGATGTEFGKTLAARLDLRSFPSSLAPRLDDHNKTLDQLDASLIITKPDAVTFEIAQWRYRLKVIAVLDVNHNNKPDWLIWLSDEAKVGNYRHYQSLLAYDVAEQGLIAVTPYPATQP